ncbi:SPO22-domain-containing protein [Cucurbitaria berberidis CBS 394.84]|uniref:SPO22-domain-containing protein n=1 Tax=Cucurbitaria berberidis CBS 394.84 TaxID=1168544 RepID=A0A9P4GVR7_9PLEO|nr:SPO22-domain-containing protein [Cucurbitaria berberidis CBS 394.84]KAF1852174.1 SPO22-domain-containing protein [Cucurbitaria berberidis CBS 394.84]
MPPAAPTVKAEREKKLKAVLAFASSLTKRLENSHDASLISDLQTQTRGLPLPASSTTSAKQYELDKLGTELWNLSTRLRRDEAGPDGKEKEETARKNRILCLLRAFAFLLLDSAGGQGAKGRQCKSCIRLMKIALKAARVSIEGNEPGTATKVLERAAEYQDVLSKAGESGGEAELADRLRAEYFAVRTTLAWRQERLDTAEHMFAKCKQLAATLTPTMAESFADLLYEIGKDALTKRNYEVAVRWLERAHDVLGEQDLEMLSPEVSELRLCTMQSIVQAYMKLKTPETQDKAWHMVKLMETDFGDKMVVSLLKIELLSDAETIDTTEFYNVLLRMIRTVVLNDTNFKTIMHHIHKLKDHRHVTINVTACKALDDLIDMRLFREENQPWIEKAVITRIWIGTTNSFAENALEHLQELFDAVAQHSSTSLSAPATHAAQTLLWKRVEAASSQEQFGAAESWCRACLHSIFDKAGAQNKAKISRKIIQCAFARQDCVAAREAHSKMSDTGRDEPVARYLMYKVALRSGDMEFECLDLVCRSSAKDATLLYACVMEAQSAGDKRQAIIALERVLDKYDYSAPAGIHLPALLRRCTARLLQSELVKDGNINPDIMSQLCTVFDGACSQAKASRRRPSTPAQQLFTAQEFEWFSKNAYNMSLKYCAEMAPNLLVKLLNSCTEFIKLLKGQNQSGAEGDLCLRLVFCEFLAACTYTTLARAEDNTAQCFQYYLEARNHSQEFRRAAAEGIDKLGGSAQADIISKHFQVVKLELEAVLKLEKWDELDDLFEQCWKYKSPDHYETLADLVLVIHSCVVKAALDVKYQSKVLSVLQKIINLTCRQPGSDITKLSRWLRCLFNLALPYDENISLKCIEQVIHMAAKKQAVSSLLRVVQTLVKPAQSLLNTPPPSSSPTKGENEVRLTDDHIKEVERYPRTELEWLATTTFNRAIDYYMQEDDDKCKTWAEKSFIIAQWLEDDGALRDLLMEKFSALQWDKK